VNRIVVIAAAVASFIVTAGYLQKPNRAEPPPVSTMSAPVAEFTTSRAQDAVFVPAASEHAPKHSVAVVDSPGELSADATVERQQLAEYVGGVSNVAPVSDEQQRAILEAKLRHRRAYETVLRDSGIQRETLSTVERDYAHRIVARALQDYRENFLLDVKPVLTDEQFTLLSNYESTEFQRELERLQININAK
jgi:hypothetical protein